jgi:fatty acid desaturase
MQRYTSYKEDITDNFKDLHFSFSLNCFFVIIGMAILSYLTSEWLILISEILSIFFLYMFTFPLFNRLKHYLLSKEE